MAIPEGLKMKGKYMNIHSLCIIKNIYGQVQEGKVWHHYYSVSECSRSLRTGQSYLLFFSGKKKPPRRGQNRRKNLSPLAQGWGALEDMG